MTSAVIGVMTCFVIDQFSVMTNQLVVVTDQLIDVMTAVINQLVVVTDRFSVIIN